MSVLPFVAAAPFALLGLHLARIAQRSHALPDRLLSTFFLLIAIGVPPRMISVDIATRVGLTWTNFWFTTAANFVIGGGLACLAAFTWQVFRPESARAKKAFLGFVAAIAVVFVSGATSLEAAAGSGPVAIAFNGLGAVALLWSFVECVLYYGTMRRRRALGMADPIVTNRFLLWSLWTGAIALQAILMMSLRIGLWSTGAGEVISGGHDPGGSWLALIGAAKGLLAVVAPAAVVSVWLSFSPPAAYRRWLMRASESA